MRALLVMTLLLSVSGVAAQANVEEARERVARGDELLERADYDAALAEFERAYEVLGEHPSRPLILFNIGRAHERMRRYDLALEYFQRYLDEAGPDAEDRDAVEATLRTLRGFLGVLVVDTNVPAQIWVDGRRVGDAPGRVWVPGGLHTVEARAEGHADAREEVQLAPQSEVRLELELEALAESYEGVRPVFFRSFVAAAAVFAVAGAAMGARALRLRSTYRDQLDDPVEGLRLGRQHEREIQRFAVLADVFVAAAAATGITALVLAFVTDWSERIEVRASNRAVELTLRGTF